MTSKIKDSLFIVLITVIGLLTACATKAKTPGTEVSALIGTWRWIKSSGGIAGTEETAIATKTAKLLNFDKNGVVTVTINDRQDLKDTYTILRIKSIFTGTETDAVRYNTTAAIKSFRISKDTLFLAEECHDCYSHVYVRK